MGAPRGDCPSHLQRSIPSGICPGELWRPYPVANHGANTMQVGATHLGRAVRGDAGVTP